VSFRQFLAASLLAVAVTTTAASGIELAPYKDRLFAYSGTIRAADGGTYAVIDYREERDINGRDEIPERRVQRSYVDLSPRRAQQERVLETGAGKLSYVSVGREEGAAIITIYLHGQGGNRNQGVNDYTFGGNFNRIKNLMTRNNGLYLSPDVADFDARGMSQISALIASHRAASPHAPVILACGSMGGALCWKLADSPHVAPALGGMLFLGSMWENDFATLEAIRSRVPILIAHGSNDKIFPVATQEEFYRKVRSVLLDYPIRFVRFETGSHGTPIRMIDWRESINWMLTARP
jgi:hypothetical protein